MPCSDVPLFLDVTETKKVLNYSDPAQLEMAKTLRDCEVPFKIIGEQSCHVLVMFPWCCVARAIRLAGDKVEVVCQRGQKTKDATRLPSRDPKIDPQRRLSSRVEISGSSVVCPKGQSPKLRALARCISPRRLR